MHNLQINLKKKFMLINSKYFILNNFVLWDHLIHSFTAKRTAISIKSPSHESHKLSIKNASNIFY